MSIKFYIVMVILIILASLFWVYFSISPNKKKRNIYFVLFSGLLALTLAHYYKPTLTKSNTTQSTTTSSTTQSSSINLEIESANTFETDSKGIATITGQTTPKAQIQITGNAMKNPVVADDKGNFSITYTMTDTEIKKIQLTATLQSKTVSKEISVIPSEKFISTQQSATKTSTSQSSK